MRGIGPWSCPALMTRSPIGPWTSSPARRHDSPVFAVVARPIRQFSAFFSLDGEARRALTRPTHLPRVRAEPFDTLSVKFAHKIGATALAKYYARLPTSSTNSRRISSTVGRHRRSSPSTSSRTLVWLCLRERH